MLSGFHSNVAQTVNVRKLNKYNERETTSVRLATIQLAAVSSKDANANANVLRIIIILLQYRCIKQTKSE